MTKGGSRGTEGLATMATGNQSRTSARSRRGSETRQRTVLVTFRLLPGELETLQAAAQNSNVSLSELLRSSALKAAVDQLSA
jgi:hypothetical protein